MSGIECRVLGPAKKGGTLVTFRLGQTTFSTIINVRSTVMLGRVLIDVIDRYIAPQVSIIVWLMPSANEGLGPCRFSPTGQTNLSMKDLLLKENLSFAYTKLPFKLGIRLPFTQFELVVLCALNIAPT
ncbi:hypothetical protein CR513_05403, partial [Mucuna pruriens]